MTAMAQSDDSQAVAAITRYGFVSIATGLAFFVSTMAFILLDERHHLLTLFVPALLVQWLAVALIYLPGLRLLRGEVAGGGTGVDKGDKALRVPRLLLFLLALVAFLTFLLSGADNTGLMLLLLLNMSLVGIYGWPDFTTDAQRSFGAGCMGAFGLFLLFPGALLAGHEATTTLLSGLSSELAMAMCGLLVVAPGFFVLFATRVILDRASDAR